MRPTAPAVGADAAQLIPLLGLAGEAGQLLSEYKKRLRDGPSHVRFVDRVREELGDILWYVSNVASKYGLALEDIAEANLAKTRARFGNEQGVTLARGTKRAKAFPTASRWLSRREPTEVRSSCGPFSKASRSAPN